MSWGLLAFLVLLLSYGGSLSGIKNNKLKIISRILLILCLSYPPAYILTEGADRDAYIALYNVGIDRFEFTNIWSWVVLSSEEFEIGFVLLLKLCNKIGLSDEAMFFVLAVIVNTLIVSVCYRFRFPIIGLLLFLLSEFYLQEANIIRQLIACSIGLYGLKYVEEKAAWKWITCVILAFLFHKTSFVLLLFTPFCFAKESWYKSVNLGIMVLWGISLLFGLGLVSLDMPSIISFMEDTRYEGMKFEETKKGFDWFCNLIMIAYLFASKEKYKNNIYGLFFAMTCIMTNFITSLDTIRRMVLYFLPIYLAYGPDILCDLNMGNGDKEKEVGKVVMVVFVFYYLRQIVGRF